MKSYDYEACVYDGAIYCTGCLPEGIATDDTYPIFAGAEVDSYPVCEHCGEVHTYMGLTSVGIVNECDRQNIERFYMSPSDFAMAQDDGSWMADAMEDNAVDWEDKESVKLESESLAGWYYWTCYPGCLPEGDAIGPFKTEFEAATEAING